MLRNAEPVKHILVVDRCPGDTNRLACELPKERFVVTYAESPEQAISFVRSRPYDCALIGMELEDDQPMRLLRAIRRESPMVKVIMMTECGDEEMWVDVLREGACDLVAKPVGLRDIQAQF